jgi:hypothetical protein
MLLLTLTFTLKSTRKDDIKQKYDKRDDFTFPIVKFISSTTKTDIFIKVVLNTITLTIAPWWGIRESPVNVPLISILYNVQAG